jgi:hypothetical protein
MRYESGDRQGREDVAPGRISGVEPDISWLDCAGLFLRQGWPRGKAFISGSIKSCITALHALYLPCHENP